MEVEEIPPQGGPDLAASSSGGLVPEAVRHAHGVVPMETEELSAQEDTQGAPFAFLQHNQAMRLEGNVRNVTNQMATLNVGVDPALAMGAVMASQAEAAATVAAAGLVIGQVQAQAATEAAAVRGEAVAAVTAANFAAQMAQSQAATTIEGVRSHAEAAMIAARSDAQAKVNEAEARVSEIKRLADQRISEAVRLAEQSGGGAAGEGNYSTPGGTDDEIISRDATAESADDEGVSAI